LDNEWVDKNDIHANEVIREFKNQNPAAEAHIRKNTTGESFIPIPSSYPLQPSNSHMSHVYYTQSPGQIYAQELTKGLLIYEDATQLCTEKYLQAKCDEELTIATAITAEELQ